MGETQIPTVVLSEVSQIFSGRVVIKNLSLSVLQGEIVALLGRTGAGKSTALNLIMGYLKPTSGLVRVVGRDPFEAASELKGKLSVSFQTDCLLPWRTALGNVELGLELTGRSPHNRHAIASEWLDRVKLSLEHHDKYPRQLSGGMRQRVSLARALAIDPEIILLDESFSQLDRATSRELRRDFVILAKKHKKTAMLVTHRIEDALEMADRIIVLGAPAEIRLELDITSDKREDSTWYAAAERDIEAALTRN